jgi:hypothetical protein
VAPHVLVLDSYWNSEGLRNFEKNWPLIEVSGALVDASGRRWTRQSTNARKSRIRDLMQSGSQVGVFSFGRQQLACVPRGEIETAWADIAK